MAYIELSETMYAPIPRGLVVMGLITVDVTEATLMVTQLKKQQAPFQTNSPKLNLIIRSTV